VRDSGRRRRLETKIHIYKMKDTNSNSQPTATKKQA
jgi:hypothetical protein